MDRLVRKFKNAALKNKIIMIAVGLLVFCIFFSAGGTTAEKPGESENTTVREVSSVTETSETTEITEPVFDINSLVGKTVSEFKKAADKNNCSYSLLYNHSKEDFSEKYGKMSADEKEKWIVDSVEANTSAEGFYKVLVSYTGDIKVPDVKNKNLSDALDELHSKEFSNIEYISNENNVIFMESNWDVISQSPDAGSTIKANDRIVLTCKKASLESSTSKTADSDKTDTSKKADTKKAKTGIDPDFKAFWDSYEKFIDKYIKVMSNPDSINNTAEYLSILGQYADFCEKAEAYDDSDNLTDEEIAYMTKVETRISAKLVNAALG